MTDISKKPAVAQANLIQNRLALLRNGYHPIPTHGKMARLAGWNTPEFVARELSDTPRHLAVDRVTRWATGLYPHLTSTGTRLDDGLGAIDGDVDHPELARLFWLALDTHAPDVAHNAPARLGGGEHKVALFARFTGDAFIKLPNKDFVQPEALQAWQAALRIDSKAPRPTSHKVEIFGGGSTPKGNCSRHFGVDGPHSYHPDGSVARFYSWFEGPTLFDTRLNELPEINKSTALKILTTFEAAAEAAGWVALPTAPGSDKRFIYDIDEATRFSGGDVGPDPVSYAVLCSMVDRARDLRVDGSFIDGSTARGDKCKVSWCDARSVVGVFDFEGDAWHLPKDTNPDVDVPPTVAETIQAMHEAAPEAPIFEGEPNWRERNKGMRPVASLHNTRLAIEASEIVCSRNTFHNRMYMGRSDAAAPAEPLLALMGQVTDDKIGALRMYLSDRFGLDFTERHVRDVVMVMCHENSFNPVVDMLAEAEASWDGKKRLDRMAVDYFNAEDTELNRRCVRKTMIAAVARARNPGCKFDTILVMELPEGLNKSSAWAVLAGEGNFSDERIMGRNDREVLEALAGVWIHENADLAGMRKADVDMVKAFASRQVDRARPAYGRFLVEQPRHSIEVGTTNSDKYLMSQTGNRRFWPVRVLETIDLAKLRKARLQLWGEAARYQSKGESLVLDEHLWEAAGVAQEARRVRHPWEATLAKITHIPSAGPLAGVGPIGNGIVHQVGDEERVPTWVIFEHVLRVPIGQLNVSHSKTLNEIMRLLGWKPGVFKFEGKTTRGYVRTKVT